MDGREQNIDSLIGMSMSRSTVLYLDGYSQNGASSHSLWLDVCKI